MSGRIGAVEQRKCAAGLAGPHHGLQHRIKSGKKTFDFLLCIAVQQTFISFPFSLLRHYQTL